jgi:hypothetical protein
MGGEWRDHFEAVVGAGSGVRGSDREISLKGGLRKKKNEKATAPFFPAAAGGKMGQSRSSSHFFECASRQTIR